MSYFSSVSHTVLWAIAIGLCSGTLAGCVDIGLDRLIGRGWLSWSIAIRDVVLQGVVFAIALGSGAFIFAILNPYGPSEEISWLTFKVCLAYGFLFPLASFISKLDQQRSPKAKK